MHWRWVHGTAHHRKPQKDRNKSYYTRAERTSELLYYLSSHHRANGNGVHMLVSDISKIEGQDGALQ